LIKVQSENESYPSGPSETATPERYLGEFGSEEASNKVGKWWQFIYAYLCNMSTNGTWDV
jgi:hypothetical protein